MSRVIDRNVLNAVVETVMVPYFRDRLAVLGLPPSLAARVVNIDAFFPRSGEPREIVDEFCAFCEAQFAASPHVYWWPWSEAWA